MPSPPEMLPPVVRDEVTPLKMSPGVLSGRVVNIDGEASFVLGLLQSLELEQMTTGDYVEISQDVDLTDLDMIELDCSVIGRSHPGLVLPAVYRWDAKIIVDGDVIAQRTIDFSDDKTWNDFRGPVRRNTGTVAIKIRLELIEV
jgi:hypothetical protein